MGMPACTITSQTAHGGIVVVGFPTVLIGMMPASRIGDNHVCPMVTGVVPHVGGPFILGSPTVLVGNMPQSRVTDQLVCVGPPDIAVMGCETVLVGMAGAGGAAGAMGGIAAMGVSVPMAAPPAAASQLQATLQQDGTIKTSASSNGCLPPLPLQQPGWPDLPREITATFQSVQPATLSDGAKAWAGQPAGLATAATRVWSPGDKMVPDLSGCAPKDVPIAQELMAQGHVVVPIDRRADPTADFFVDGVKTELKTLNKANKNTLKNEIENATRQSNENILINARNVDISAASAKAEILRAEGNLLARGKGNLAGRVTVWTKDGIVRY